MAGAQQSQPQSVVTGDYSLLEDLLDGVAIEPGLGLEESVERLDGLPYLHDQTQKKFRAELCKPFVQECLAWARVHPDLAELRGRTEQSIQQLAAVRLWTGCPVCYVVTCIIRDRTRTQASVEPIRLFLKFLYKGLHGLPRKFIYTGKLYRGETGVRDNWSQVMKKGFVFGFCAPTSFSTSPEVVQSFKNETGPRTCYIIEDGVGYRLDKISKYPKECEVLLEGVAMVRVESTNDDYKVIGEADAEFFCATCTMQCGVPMLQGSPVREKEREVIYENLGANEGGQKLNKKDFTEAPFKAAEWRKRKRLDDEAYDDEVLDTKTLSLLGKGTFAKTYRMLQVSTGTHFAAKMLKRSKLGPDFNEDRFKAEVKLVQALRHRNVIECKGWYSTLKEFVIVMEYMPDGNLADLMATMSGLELGRTVADQIGRALDYMHRECPQRVVHSDIKPENVLVGTTGTTNVERVLKLADFGLAYVASTTQGTQITKGGTPCYLSPEQADSNLCGTKADMWALGCVLVEAVSGERLRGPLCKDSPEVRERRTDLIVRTGLASKGLGKVAAGLLDVNKHTRLSAKEMADMMVHDQKQALAAAVAAGYIPQDHPINNPISRTALGSVAFRGDLDGVTLLLEAGAGVDVKDSLGWTPLHHAAHHGRLKCMRLLLEVGADKEAKTKDGWTPLHAALECHLECVRVLLEAGADKEAKNKDGRTPLHRAASGGHFKCARVLLEAGADKEAKDEDGKTPLHYAAANGHVKCARVLLLAGADKEAKDKGGFTPLHRAASKGSVECARVLQEAGADKEAKDKNGNTPLHLAADAGHDECARVLLEAGADKEAKDTDGWTPLHWAAFNGHDECARVLLEAGADKEAKSRFGKTPLHLAADEGYDECARVLLEAGADKEAKDKDESTPLHLAAYKGRIECVRLLVEEGADKEAKDTDGKTPLHDAASQGHVECVRLLLEAGADKEAKNEDENTPLHLAAWKGCIECVRLLVEAGADKEAKDTGGSTPLHDAASNGHVECVKLLIDAGADKEAKNEEGTTALDVAKQGLDSASGLAGKQKFKSLVKVLGGK